MVGSMAVISFWRVCWSWFDKNRSNSRWSRRSNKLVSALHRGVFAPYLLGLNQIIKTVPLFDFRTPKYRAILVWLPTIRTSSIFADIFPMASAILPDAPPTWPRRVNRWVNWQGGVLDLRIKHLPSMGKDKPVLSKPFWPKSATISSMRVMSSIKLLASTPWVMASAALVKLSRIFCFCRAMAALARVSGFGNFCMI